MPFAPFQIPAPSSPTKRRQHGFKIGKKLEAVEQRVCALPLHARSEQSFRAIAESAGVNEKTIQKRWGMVFALLQALQHGCTCRKAL